MSIETIIGLPDQLTVESFGADARLVPSHEKNGPAPSIEGESHSPFAIGRGESKFFHVRVTGPFQGVNAGPP